MRSQIHTTKVKWAWHRVSDSNAAIESFLPGQVLARVGGEPVFVGDMMLELSQIIEQFIPTAPQEIKDARKTELIPRLLPKYIDGKILFVAMKQDLPDTAKIEDILKSAEEQFDEVMLPRMLEKNGVNSHGQLDLKFRSLGSSLRHVRKNWAENELVKYMLRSKINSGADVSHRELFDYYQENKETFSFKGKVQWEQVMVRFDRFGSRDEARDAIAKMGNEIVYGAALAAVAKSDSHGFRADEGGQQGWVHRASLADKKLDDLLFSIEPGKLSEIVETTKGLHIVRVLERVDAGFTPFADAQITIQETLQQEKQERVFKEHVAKLRDRIPVEIYERTETAQQPGVNQLK